MELNEKSERLVKSIMIAEYGGFDKIKIIEAPLIPSVCGEHDLEIKVRYCGVNFADLYMRQGLLQHLNLPHILGLECLGIVQQIGEKVASFKVGQRVLCYNGNGGMYREILIINEQNCFPVPDYVEDEFAVALPANYLTAYFCLYEIGNLKSNQNILIHSCAGGVGWAATQLAHNVENIKVTGICSQKKFTEVLRNGVDHVLTRDKYLEQLQHKKFDIIIDSVGGSNIADSQSLLDTLGKLIIIGASQIMTGDGRFNILQLLKLWWQTKNICVTDLIMKNNVVAGLHMTNVMENKLERVRSAMNQIYSLYKAGKIKPRIDSKFPFDKAAEAMKKLADRENIGKVIIELV